MDSKSAWSRPFVYFGRRQNDVINLSGQEIRKRGITVRDAFETVDRMECTLYGAPFEQGS